MSKLKKYIPLFVSIILLLLLIYFSNIQKILSIFSKANPIFLLTGLSMWAVIALLRSLRWKYLLHKVDIAVSLKTTFEVFTSGLFISNLTPAKTGEPIRSVLLKKSKGKSLGRSLPSIFFEKIFDIVALVTISLAGVISFVSRSYQMWFIISLVLYVFVISFGIYILLSQERTEKLLTKLEPLISLIPLVENPEEKIAGFSSDLSRAFRKFGNSRIVMVTFLYSFLLWICMGTIYLAGFYALNIPINPLICIVIVSISVLISMVTALPGGLGSKEVVFVAILTSISGLTAPEATAGVLLGGFMSFWTTVIVGSFLFSKMGVGIDLYKNTG